MNLDINTGADIEKTCSFTGYRPQKLPFGNNRNSEGYKRLYDRIKKEILYLYDNGVRYFQSGMALGTDIMCALAVAELQETIDISLLCAVPCIGQSNRWNREDKSIYKRLLDKSSKVVYVSNSAYYDGCMQKRNRYLVDTAGYVIAVFDGKSGGTMETVNYAKKKERTIIVIDPSDDVRVELLHNSDKGVFYV